jgi:hypothetical protein
MSSNPKVIFRLVFCALVVSSISPRFASAQNSERDSTWAVLDVVATINNAIEASDDALNLRARAVRRLAECSLAYGGLSTLTSRPETKKSYVDAQLATSQVEAAIGKPLQKDARLELEEAARRSVALMLRSVKTQGEKEIGPLIKSCKALNNAAEVKRALQELPPR